MEAGVPKQRLDQILLTRSDVIGHVFNHARVRRAIGEQPAELRAIPVFERLDGPLARLLVLVAGKDDEDLDLFFQRHGQGALRALAADDRRRRAFA